jgi:hypothetical protein
VATALVTLVETEKVAIAKYSTEIVKTSNDKEVMILIKIDDGTLYEVAYNDHIETTIRLSNMSVSQVKTAISFESFKKQILVRGK